MPVRAILMDLDGTLADSLSVMRHVYDRFLGRFQRPATTAEFDSLNGPPLPEVVRRLKASHGLDGDVDHLLALYRTLIDEAYGAVQPQPGAGELLSQAKDCGCITAIVTSNARRTTQRWLDAAGLADRIDFIVAGEDVRFGKPDPEPYLAAVKQTGLRPDQAVALEDSPQGAASAISAGLRTFVLDVGRGHSWPGGAIPIPSLTEAVKRLWPPSPT